MIRYKQTDGGCNRPEERAADLDCTVRALAVAGGMSYETAWQTMSESGRKPTAAASMLAGLEQAKDKRLISFSKLPTNRPTLAQFTHENPRGKFIARVRSYQRGLMHVIAIIDGVVCDVQPVSARKRVYMAWEVKSGG